MKIYSSFQIQIINFQAEVHNLVFSQIGYGTEGAILNKKFNLNNLNIKKHNQILYNLKLF